MTPKEKVVFETKEEKMISEAVPGMGNGAGKAADTDEAAKRDGAGDGTATSNNGTKPDEAAVPDDDTKRDAAEDTDRDILEIILDNKDDEKEEVPNGIVKLSKPVSFDGQIIETIDLRELQNISQKKAKKIRKVYNKIAENFTVSPESTEEYAMAAASVITKLPVELFEQLPHKDIVKIRTRVINFFFLD